jgi:hypothetical protein
MRALHLLAPHLPKGVVPKRIKHSFLEPLKI